MKKLARPFSAIAMLIAIVICFSGCGIVDFTRSIFHKENTDVTVSLDGTQVNNTVTNNNQGVTNSVDVIPPSTQAQTHTPVTDNTVTSNVGNSDDTTASNEHTTPVPTPTPTPTPTEPNLDPTDAPVEDSDGGLTDEQLENLSVKELQDMLFATKDPNTAGKILEIAGFEYDDKQGIYYSQMNPLQRKFGFNLVYDMAAPMAGMLYDTKRIEFEYDDREWMIQIWKGQYGITSGAEIGLYNRDPERNFQYDCADDEDLIEMQFDFYNQNEFVFSRGPEKHWWLTGFKVFHAGIPILIDLDMQLTFTDKQMARAFIQSLKQTAASSFLDPITYRMEGKTVYIHW